MNIHEHQAKQILKKYGVAVPEGVFSHSIDAVKALWEAASKIDPDLSK